jgi:2-polyprenyl-3-methyl-5-hydroxy-6-metoxy-1,4-benzoquinol methylase
LVEECDRILDYGCFDGTITQLLAKKAKEVVGVDNSESAVSTVVNRGLHASLIINDRIPYNDGYFDTVLASEVIEHIFDTDKFLSEVYRVLRPSGTLIISTPNLASIGSRLTLLCGETPWMMEINASDKTSGHIRYFTHKTLKGLLAKNGFKVEISTSDLIHITPYFYTSNNAISTKFNCFGRIIIMKCKKI